jgi:hypothetical protein
MLTERELAMFDTDARMHLKSHGFTNPDQPS